MYISIRCSVQTNDYLFLTDITRIVAISNKLHIRMDMYRKFDKFVTSNNHIIGHTRLFKILWQKCREINFLLNKQQLLFDTIGIETVAVIKNKEQSFNIFDGHSSDLHGIPHLLSWELHFGYHWRNLEIIFANFLLINRGCSFEVKGVFVFPINWVNIFVLGCKWLYFIYSLFLSWLVVFYLKLTNWLIFSSFLFSSCTTRLD